MFFSVPTQTHYSRLAPRVSPGVSPESTKAVQDIMQDDFEKYHAYWTVGSGLHNHNIHQALALWALGAPAEAIRATYDVNKKVLTSSYASPGIITDETFNAHLGDENYYSAYINFFKQAVGSKGVDATMEEYVFSEKANASSGVRDHPLMLNRFLSVLFHSMIHTAYGVEFDIFGIVVEGLAWTAVHQPDAPGLVLPLYATTSETLVSKTNGLQLEVKQGVHIFAVLARIINDERLNSIRLGDRLDFINNFHKVVDSEEYTSTIIQHANAWIVDTANEAEVEKKIEELQWMTILMFAAPKQTNGPRADFFLMHNVTSSLFLPIFVKHLSPASQVRFLQSYLRLCISWYISRGCPQLDLPGFFAGPLPSFPSSIPSSTRYSVLPKSATAPNSWSFITDSAIVHSDFHLCKVVRALAHYASIYGARKAGEEDFKGTELADAEKIDGSLFLRAAALSLERETVTTEDGKYYLWDRDGYFNH